MITIDHGKWDMHSGLGDLGWGQMLENATEMSPADRGLLQRPRPLGDNVTLVALSEFGRRVQENVNVGLDHGYGNVMMLAGAGVKGGYYAKWPGITNELDSDLLVTTDYRSVLAEVVSARFGASSASVFPGFVREPVGVMARPVGPSFVGFPAALWVATPRRKESPGRPGIPSTPAGDHGLHLADRGRGVDVAYGVPAGRPGGRDVRRHVVEEHHLLRLRRPGARRSGA